MEVYRENMNHDHDQPTKKWALKLRWRVFLHSCDVSWLHKGSSLWNTIKVFGHLARCVCCGAMIYRGWDRRNKAFLRPIVGAVVRQIWPPAFLEAAQLSLGKNLKATQRRSTKASHRWPCTPELHQVEALISIICFVYCDGAEFKWVPLPNSDVKLITFPTLLCATWKRSAPPTKNCNNFQFSTWISSSNEEISSSNEELQPGSAPPTENGSNFQTATLLTICRLNLFPARQIIVLCGLWPGPRHDICQKWLSNSRCPSGPAKYQLCLALVCKL